MVLIGNPSTTSLTILNNAGGVPRPSADNTGPSVPRTLTLPTTIVNNAGWFTSNQDGTHIYTTVEGGVTYWVFHGIYFDGQLEFGNANTFFEDVIIEDCEFNGGDGVTGSSYGINPVHFDNANFRIRRCEFYGNTSAAVINRRDFDLQSNYVHDCGADGFNSFSGLYCAYNYVTRLGLKPLAHCDAVDANSGGDAVYEYNFLSLEWPQPNGFVVPNSLFFISASEGNPVSNVSIRYNWIDGGDKSIRANEVNGGTYSNIEIIGNRFSTRYQITSLDTNVPYLTRPDFTVSGNIWDTDPVLVPQSGLRGKVIEASDNGNTGFAQE